MQVFLQEYLCNGQILLALNSKKQIVEEVVSIGFCCDCKFVIYLWLYIVKKLFGNVLTWAGEVQKSHNSLKYAWIYALKMSTKSSKCNSDFLIIISDFAVNTNLPFVNEAHFSYLNFALRHQHGGNSLT